MENTLYIALSQQLGIRREMSVIANNLANGLTPGYKAESMMFVEYLSKPKGGGRSNHLSFVQDIAVARDMREGDLTHTDNPLDFAIHGSGWFVVQTAAGERYTRNGHFQLDVQGQLVTSSGDPVIGTRGEVIRFEPDDTRIVAKGDGSIEANGEPRGQLRIVSFENEQRLRKESGSLYRSDALPGEAAAASVVQGKLEKSNVRSIIELTTMMEAVRTYQGAQRLIQNEHDRLRGAIQKLTRER